MARPEFSKGRITQIEREDQAKDPAGYDLRKLYTRQLVNDGLPQIEEQLEFQIFSDKDPGVYEEVTDLLKAHDRSIVEIMKNRKYGDFGRTSPKPGNEHMTERGIVEEELHDYIWRLRSSPNDGEDTIVIKPGDIELK